MNSCHMATSHLSSFGRLSSYHLRSSSAILRSQCPQLLRSVSSMQSLAPPFACHGSTAKRGFTSPPPPPDSADFTKLRRLEDANPERIRGIQLNPDGIGSKVLPGNLVYKKYKWSGNTRKVPLELVHGYFWMMWDLKNTNGKPILSNDKLIAEEDAQAFPMLTGLETLDKVKTDLPYFIMDNTEAKCTLVNIAFRESGYKNISSWSEPLSKAFEGDPRVETVTLSITERWSLYLLKGALANTMRKNTPASEHANTLLYFGSDVDDFRDILRMHNLMANYVFLVDDLGRIRFAGSGPATEEDVSSVIRFAHKLSTEGGRKGKGGNSKRSPGGRKR